MTASARSRWKTALIAFSSGSLSTLALAAGLYWGFFHRPDSTTPGSTEPPAYPRTEFTRLVMGKDQSQVIEAVGKPDGTSQDESATYWHFKKRTRDPLTSKIDTDVQVVLNDGKVVSIHY